MREARVRTIAATFETSTEAEEARRRLTAASVSPGHIAVAPAVVADSDGPQVRDLLEAAGGHLVADVEVH
jgi:hypothetical protein